MVRMSLPLGFRFRPTDVELVLYYLKRKVMGKKLHYEAIAEVNIYKFSPWDLPDKSCLKSKDLEWFFFCPREKKYASGNRFKRATENGFWKTTGKERDIRCNERTVGTAKTLVFHLGHAPQGERTDWVIHEYKILDDQLAAAGVQIVGAGAKTWKATVDHAWTCNIDDKRMCLYYPSTESKMGVIFYAVGRLKGVIQESHYVPMNNLSADKKDCAHKLLLSAFENQKDITSFDDEASLLKRFPCRSSDINAATNSSIQEGSNGCDLSISENINGCHPTGPDIPSQSISPDTSTSDGPSQTTVMQPEEQSFPLERGLFGPGNTSGLPVLEEGPSPSAGGSTSEVVVDEAGDEIEHVLASFADEDTLLSNKNGINQDDLSGKGTNECLPCPDGYDIYNGLGDLDSWAQMNEGRLDFFGMQNDDYSLNNMLPQDNSAYIELDDLLPPLDCSNGVTGTDQSSFGEIIGSHSRENMQQFHSGAIFTGIDQYASCANELPEPLEGSHVGDNCLDVLQMVDHQIYPGSNASYDLDFTFRQLENMSYPAHDMERGSHIKKCFSRLMECIPARLPSAAEHLALSFSPCGGSSIHIKAEVTHGAGECTNEALSVMMGGSGSCWCNLPWAVFQKMELWFAKRLLYLVHS